MSKKPARFSTKIYSSPVTVPRASPGNDSKIWWAVLDLNQRPKDYAYHFGFRRPFPVRGLDSILPFGFPVESLHVPQY